MRMELRVYEKGDLRAVAAVGNWDLFLTRVQNVDPVWASVLDGGRITLRLPVDRSGAMKLSPVVRDAFSCVRPRRRDGGRLGLVCVDSGLIVHEAPSWPRLGALVGADPRKLCRSHVTGCLVKGGLVIGLDMCSDFAGCPVIAPN